MIEGSRSNLQLSTVLKIVFIPSFESSSTEPNRFQIQMTCVLNYRLTNMYMIKKRNNVKIKNNKICNSFKETNINYDRNIKRKRN